MIWVDMLWYNTKSSLCYYCLQKGEDKGKKVYFVDSMFRQIISFTIFLFAQTERLWTEFNSVGGFSSLMYDSRHWIIRAIWVLIKRKSETLMRNCSRILMYNLQNHFFPWAPFAVLSIFLFLASSTKTNIELCGKV